MTKEERLIVSAYTGVLMTSFNEFHKFAEEKLGRPIFTHEFADKVVIDDLKEAVYGDFMSLCGD